MDGFEDMLNSVLSSPEDMEKIMGIAQKLTGGAKAAPAEQKPEPEPDMPELDPATLSRVMGLLKKLRERDDGKAALIASMKPYVRPERRETLDRAVKVAGIVRVARAAVNEFGGDFHFGL